MLLRCITAEWMKQRRSGIWILLSALPLVSVLIGCANFMLNQGVLQHEWYSLWSQVGLFYGEFFFPILIAIGASYLGRLEHSNGNWRLLLSAPIRPASIWLAKLFMLALFLGYVQLLFLILYYAGGRWIGLPPGLPAEWPGWIFRGWVAGMAIGSMQLALSMHIRSFAVPVGIGLSACIIGLGLYVLKLGLLFPHSLLTIGMGVLNQEPLITGTMLGFYVMCILYIAALSALAIRRLERGDAG